MLMCIMKRTAIVLYEALRQNNFDHMRLEGHLTKYDWK